MKERKKEKVGKGRREKYKDRNMRTAEGSGKGLHRGKKERNFAKQMNKTKQTIIMQMMYLKSDKK